MNEFLEATPLTEEAGQPSAEVFSPAADYVPPPSYTPQVWSPPVEPSTDGTGGQTYRVQKGDTLWKIAKEKYGDGSLYPEIFKANQDTLSDPDQIQVGQKLRIP